LLAALFWFKAWIMTQAQLNIRSTKAKNLATDLAKNQRRTVSQIVEIALEHYAREMPATKPREEKPANFWRDLNTSLYPTGNEQDVDLEAVINENRKPHDPIKL
jgi:hypothetical protein